MLRECVEDCAASIFGGLLGLCDLKAPGSKVLCGVPQVLAGHVLVSTMSTNGKPEPDPGQKLSSWLALAIVLI